MNLLIVKILLLISIFLGVWGVDISFSLVITAPKHYVYTFWGQYWNPMDYFHLSLVVIMFSSLALLITSITECKKVEENGGDKKVL